MSNPNAQFHVNFYEFWRKKWNGYGKGNEREAIVQENEKNKIERKKGRKEGRTKERKKKER